MASVLDQVGAEVLLALAAVLDDPANAAVAEASIASGESAVEAAVADVVKNMPQVKGALGLFENALLPLAEQAVQASVAGFFAKESPAAVVAAASAWLKAEAAKVAAAA